MGSRPNWNSSTWSAFKKSNNIGAGTSASQIFSQTTASEYLPYKITRESRDSELHPLSTAYILGLDTTGSMDAVLEACYKGLNTTIEEIFKRITTCDPQIMCAAIDDTEAMKALGAEGCPALQVTQFEPDIEIARQLKGLKQTGYGCGNGYESYPLLWYFASRHVSADCYEKRRKKGVLITLGDDGIQDVLRASEISRVFGDESVDIDIKDLYREVSKKFEVYHLALVEGASYTHDVFKNWSRVVGERVLPVSDITKLPEIIVSVIEAAEGHEVSDIVNSWNGSTQVAVRETLSGLMTKPDSGTGLVRF